MSLLDGGDAPDQVCLSGEGTTGAVSFCATGGTRKREVVCEEVVLEDTEFVVRGVAGEPAETGKGKACLILVGEGSGAAARPEGFDVELLTTEPESLEAEEGPTSSASFLRLVSVLGISFPI